MAPPNQMRNLGPSSQRLLADIGVSTPSDISRIGPVPIYVMLKRLERPVTWNLLWSLQACIMDIDWRCLPRDIKIQLKEQVMDSLRHHDHC
jgi:hypothetical protein